MSHQRTNPVLLLRVNVTVIRWGLESLLSQVDEILEAHPLADQVHRESRGAGANWLPSSVSPAEGFEVREAPR